MNHEVPRTCSARYIKRFSSCPRVAGRIRARSAPSPPTSFTTSTIRLLTERRRARLPKLSSRSADITSGGALSALELSRRRAVGTTTNHGSCSRASSLCLELPPLLTTTFRRRRPAQHYADLSISDRRNAGGALSPTQVRRDRAILIAAGAILSCVGSFSSWSPRASAFAPRSINRGSPGDH